MMSHLLSDISLLLPNFAKPEERSRKRLKLSCIKFKFPFKTHFVQFQSSVYRKRPDEDLQHHLARHRPHRVPSSRHQDCHRARQEVLQRQSGREARIPKGRNTRHQETSVIQSNLSVLSCE